MKYNIQCLETHLGPYDNTEAAVQRCSLEKVFWKYAANLQKNTHAKALNLQSNFIEIALRHGCSPVNLLHIFRTLFPKNTSGWLLLIIVKAFCENSYNHLHLHLHYTCFQCLTYAFATDFKHHFGQNMPGCGFSVTRIFLYKDKIVDFILMRENTGQRKPIFWYIIRRGFVVTLLPFKG